MQNALRNVSTHAAEDETVQLPTKPSRGHYFDPLCLLCGVLEAKKFAFPLGLRPKSWSLCTESIDWAGSPYLKTVGANASMILYLGEGLWPLKCRASFSLWHFCWLLPTEDSIESINAPIDDSQKRIPTFQIIPLVRNKEKFS